MFVIKHCRAEDRLRMLEGQFKIGSHSEYSGSEATGLLSDDSEGLGTTEVIGELTSFTGVLGGITFSNLSVTGGERAIGVMHKTNSLMFCASTQPYSKDRHRKILEGDTDYTANPESCAHIALDVDRLLSALKAATDEHFGQDTKWIAQPVEYADRTRTIPAERFRGLSTTELVERAKQLAFIKPKRFSCEEEFRFLMLPTRNIEPPKAIFTSNLSQPVQRQFVDSISNAGSASL